MNLLIRSTVAATSIAATLGAMLSDAQASPVSNSQAHRSSLSYRSAFEGYRAYDEPQLSSWREANELVGRIGGWQAYAREAAGKDSHQGHHGHHRHNAETAPASSSKAKLPAAPQHSTTHQHHSTLP